MPLREQLTTITDVMDIAQHAQLLANLSQEIPNTIAICEQAQADVDFNCVMFALDLIGWIDPPWNVLGHYHADMVFLAHLICSEELRVVDNPVAGNLAVYSAEGEVKHVGIVVGENRVRSKWGSGHTYDHGLWEVPHAYGDAVRYYTAIDGELAKDLLVAFKGW